MRPSRSICCLGCPMIWGVCLTAVDVLIVLLPAALSASVTSKRWSSLLIVGIAGSLRDRAVACQAGPDRRRAGDSCRSTQIVRNPDMLYIAVGHSRRDRHAAQPVSALVDRADAEVRRRRRRAGRRRSRFAIDRLDRRADVRALPQRRHSRHGGGDVPRHRPSGRRGHLRRVSAAGAAPRHARWRARSLRSPCCSPDRTRR